MSKGSNPSNVTTTSTNEPSEYIQPYLTPALNDAQNLYESSAPNFYPDATYVGFAPETEQALKLAQARAIQGNPLLGSAQTEVNNVLTGQYLNPGSNPYLQNLYSDMAGDVTSAVNSQFTNAGRFGSGANQEILADSLGQLANEVYANNYNTERANMVNSTQLAPGLADADYTDIQALAGVGAERENLSTAMLEDSLGRFNYEQQKPYAKLNQYLGALGAPVPQTTISNKPVFRNVGGSLLSGALQGADLAGNFNSISPGMGAAGGGLLGLLG